MNYYFYTRKKLFSNYFLNKIFEIKNNRKVRNEVLPQKIQKYTQKFLRQSAVKKLARKLSLLSDDKKSTRHFFQAGKFRALLSL